MATLTVQNTSITGTAETYAAVAASDVFANDGRTIIRVVNAGGSPDTVGIDSTTTCNYGFDHDGGGSVTNGTSKTFGPFDPSRFNNSNGQVTVTHSFTTSVTCAVIRLP
jgi:hypothetical protein